MIQVFFFFLDRNKDHKLTRGALINDLILCNKNIFLASVPTGRSKSYEPKTWYWQDASCVQ